MKPTGYIVFDSAEDWEQALCLDTRPHLPDGGILDWRENAAPVTIFPNRKEAQVAIFRTEHYRLAFGSNHPDRKCCKIVPVKSLAKLEE